VIDYALAMRRLEEERQMDRMLRRGEVTRAHVWQIARQLSGFHARTMITPGAESASQLNARFERDEDSPESELNRLRISVGRKISSLVNEAHNCIDLKDASGAHNYLDDAERLAKGMGVDTYAIAEARGLLKPPVPVSARATCQADQSNEPEIICRCRHPQFATRRLNRRDDPAGTR
jgi:hypothetical protein